MPDRAVVSAPIGPKRPTSGARAEHGRLDDEGQEQQRHDRDDLVAHEGADRDAEGAEQGRDQGAAHDVLGELPRSRERQVANGQDHEAQQRDGEQDQQRHHQAGRGERDRLGRQEAGSVGLGQQRAR